MNTSKQILKIGFFNYAETLTDKEIKKTIIKPTPKVYNNFVSTLTILAPNESNVTTACQLVVDSIANFAIRGVVLKNVPNYIAIILHKKLIAAGFEVYYYCGNGSIIQIS